MVESKLVFSITGEAPKKRQQLDNSNHNKLNNYKKLASMCRACAGTINELYSPIDSINRFINLALQTIEEDSQGRQFLIESKQGIRDTSTLLKKLDNHTKRIEKEIRKISEFDE